MKKDRTAGVDSKAIRGALDTQVRLITGRVPPEVMAKVLKIRQAIAAMLPRLQDLPAGSPELFIVERIATSYLPISLDAYLKLPRTFARGHTVQGGKTPTEILLDQLSLLETKINELAQDIPRHDADRLLANGRFLEERFGRSPLSIKPPPTRER